MGKFPSQTVQISVVKLSWIVCLVGSFSPRIRRITRILTPRGHWELSRYFAAEQTAQSAKAGISRFALFALFVVLPLGTYRIRMRRPFHVGFLALEQRWAPQVQEAFRVASLCRRRMLLVVAPPFFSTIRPADQRGPTHEYFHRKESLLWNEGKTTSDLAGCHKNKQAETEETKTCMQTWNPRLGSLCFLLFKQIGKLFLTRSQDTIGCRPNVVRCFQSLAKMNADLCRTTRADALVHRTSCSFLDGKLP